MLFLTDLSRDGFCSSSLSNMELSSFDMGWFYVFLCEETHRVLFEVNDKLIIELCFAVYKELQSIFILCNSQNLNITIVSILQMRKLRLRS